MPIYEYRCEKCGQLNEFLILGTQNRLSCQQCGSEALNEACRLTIRPIAHPESLLTTAQNRVTYCSIFNFFSNIF